MPILTENQLISQAIVEDKARQDVTTNTLIPKTHTSKAAIIAREEAIVCGVNIAKKIFKKLDPQVKFRIYHSDGEKIKKNGTIILIKGKTRAVLAGERVALNFLGLLSGIATLTNTFVKRAACAKVKIMDTRKTPPGLRALARRAVRCGGGGNHRFDLSATVLIKDNHLIASQKNMPLAEAIRHVKKKTSKSVEVEVDTLAQMKQALAGRPDIILLDNMTPAQIKKAVTLRKKSERRCLLEASGGVSLKNIRSIARTGVDRISIGALTHSPKAIDFSLELIK